MNEQSQVYSKTNQHTECPKKIYKFKENKGAQKFLSNSHRISFKTLGLTTMKSKSCLPNTAEYIYISPFHSSRDLSIVFIISPPQLTEFHALENTAHFHYF